MEDVINLALSRGLTLADFDRLTVGMIIDYAVSCSNREIRPGDAVYATQADIDAF